MFLFSDKEFSALIHALGNVLCQKDHPDWDVLAIAREKMRSELAARKRAREAETELRKMLSNLKESA